MPSPPAEAGCRRAREVSLRHRRTDTHDLDRAQLGLVEGQVRMAHDNRLAATLASFGRLGDRTIRSQPLLVLPGAEPWALSRSDGRVALGRTSW